MARGIMVDTKVFKSQQKYKPGLCRLEIVDQRRGQVDE